jgi:hypothetical protein
LRSKANANYAPHDTTLRTAALFARIGVLWRASDGFGVSASGLLGWAFPSFSIVPANTTFGGLFVEAHLGATLVLW